jgi:hypothetical protein
MSKMQNAAIRQDTNSQHCWYRTAISKAMLLTDSRCVRLNVLLLTEKNKHLIYLLNIGKVRTGQHQSERVRTSQNGSELIRKDQKGTERIRTDQNGPERIRTSYNE